MFRPQNALNLSPQEGQVKRGDLPDNRHVHLEVGVNKAIPQAHYLAPWYVGMFLTKLLWKVARRLADDLQLANYRVLYKFAFEELFSRDVCQVTLHSLDSVHDVTQVDRAILHHTE